MMMTKDDFVETYIVPSQYPSATNRIAKSNPYVPFTSDVPSICLVKFQGKEQNSDSAVRSLALPANNMPIIHDIRTREDYSKNAKCFGQDKFQIAAGSKALSSIATPFTGAKILTSGASPFYRANSESSDSAVSDLFHRMYQSSMSNSPEMFQRSSGDSGSSSSDILSERSNSDVVQNNQFVKHLEPMRTCSSQDNLREMEAMEGQFKTREAPDFVQYSKQYSKNSLNKDQETMEVFEYKTKMSKHKKIGCKNEKLIFSPGCVLATDFPGSSGCSQFMPKETHFVNGNEEFCESEEPLPCDFQPKEVKALVNRKTDNFRPYVPSGKDVQPMVFTRDMSANKSFSSGATRHADRFIQQSEIRSGSMPYRMKMSSPPPGSTANPFMPAMPNSAFQAVTTGATVVEVTEQRNESSKLRERKENPSQAPEFSGPRLIPMDQVQERAGDESLLRATSEMKDNVTAQQLAKRLFELNGFRKSDVAKHLGKRNDFSQLVGVAFIQHFDFTSQSLDVALREFLQHLVLSGETQERERILAQFSRRYTECNPDVFSSQDSCHTLVCAIMLLNTDLHGENGKKRMTANEFIENLAGLNNGENFPKDLLKDFYHSIKTQPIEFQMDEDEVNPDPSRESQSGLSEGNPFLDVPDPSKAREFKTGYLMRKCCLESNHQRTPVGKRGWKMFRASLRDLILYLHKDEHGFGCGATFDDTSNAIRIHHSLAMEATDYTKRHDVFRLRTAEWAEYLFQASDSNECKSWIETINQVAAAFSAPPLPGAVGSQVKFQRPLMPSSCTKLQLRDQLVQHEQTMSKIESDLAEHREFTPEKGSRDRVIQDYLEKEKYLEFEQCRFRTYCTLLSEMFGSSLDSSEILTAEGYFGRNKRLQGHLNERSDPKQPSSVPEQRRNLSDRQKKPHLQGVDNASGGSIFHGMHPAKSVPALIFESRV